MGGCSCGARTPIFSQIFFWRIFKMTKIFPNFSFFNFMISPPNRPFLAFLRKKIFPFKILWTCKFFSYGEKKTKNLSSSNFFFRLVVSPDALKKNLAVKIFFPKNFDLIIFLQFWRFQVRFYWISTRDRLTFRHEGDKRQGTWLTTRRRDVTTWRDNDDSEHASVEESLSEVHNSVDILFWPHPIRYV